MAKVDMGAFEYVPYSNAGLTLYGKAVIDIDCSLLFPCNRAFFYRYISGIMPASIDYRFLSCGYVGMDNAGVI